MLVVVCFRDAGDGDDFQVIINAGTEQVESLKKVAVSIWIPGKCTANQVTGLTGVTNIDVIATVYKSDRSAKAKTTERMKILKLDKFCCNCKWSYSANWWIW